MFDNVIGATFLATRFKAVFFCVAMLYLCSSSFCFPPYLSPLSLLNSFTIESGDILCFSYQKSYNVRLSLNTNIWASLPVHLVHKCVTFI